MTGREAPIFVLGCHRSGTSAITGLLHRAGGLELGDILPPTQANPRGYFESAGVVFAHNRMLASMDRDWTCPPSSFHPQDVDLSLVKREFEDLSSVDGPWGIKDPRSLFLLPAWCEFVNEFRFVGVVRSQGDVIRSIVTRDGVDQAAVDLIVQHHVTRLAMLHRQFGFPIINFSAPPDDVIERTATVAKMAGLAWRPEEASDFFTSSLVHNRSKYENPTDDEAYLMEASRLPAESMPTIAADAVLELLDRGGEEPTNTPLRIDVGPRHNARRAETWREVSDDISGDLRTLELTSSASAASRLRAQPVDASLVEVRSVTDAIRAMRDNPGFDVLVVTGITDHLSSDEIGTMMAAAVVYGHALQTAVVEIRARTGDKLLPQPRYEHSADDLAKTLANHWKVVRVTEPDRGVCRLLLRTDLPDDPTTLALAQRIDANSERIDDVIGSLERLIETLNEPEQPLSNGDLATTRRQLEKSEQKLLQAERKLRRLSGRRAVRFALAFAERTRPLFKFIRKLR